jgi:hypothetical protein
LCFYRIRGGRYGESKEVSKEETRQEIGEEEIALRRHAPHSELKPRLRKRRGFSFAGSAPSHAG